MKIDPKHDYRKPIYAVGLAALMTTGLVTGCIHDKDEGTDVKVRTGHARTTEPQIEGGLEIIETETDIELAGEETVCTDEIELDGDVAVIETDETDTELSGDVVIVQPDDDDPQIDGGAPVETED